MGPVQHDSHVYVALILAAAAAIASAPGMTNFGHLAQGVRLPPVSAESATFASATGEPPDLAAPP